mmetsp:Transcript_6951/g.14243  ORF Transcript_6951/g.14243 Transcript_6951/m.14243 type:complete len:179 (-) Transcript_6951:239-775(-)|eukprot:scaffold516_cov175-Amphora_coffeaeformis.AAC.9
MFVSYSRTTDVTGLSTPIQNQAIIEPTGGREAFSTPGSDSMPTISQDISTSSKMPCMPMVELEETKVDATSRFFLATPAEIGQEREVSRIPQFQSNEQETPGIGHTDRTMSLNYQSASPVSCNGEGKWDDDDMMDEEVAVASDRAHRYQQGLMTAKFKLRPKPLGEEEAWDPDFLYRS